MDQSAAQEIAQTPASNPSSCAASQRTSVLQIAAQAALASAEAAAKAASAAEKSASTAEFVAQAAAFESLSALGQRGGWSPSFPLSKAIVPGRAMLADGSPFIMPPPPPGPPQVGPSTAKPSSRAVEIRVTPGATSKSSSSHAGSTDGGSPRKRKDNEHFHGRGSKAGKRHRRN